MIAEIVDLGDVPHLRATVSDRIWRAWWQEQGVALGDVDARVGEALTAQTVPSTLVALVDGTFAGTVSLIDSDLDERPQYSPWIAALWVDPAFRRHGIGAALVAAAARMAFTAGHLSVYLAATSANAPFYLGLGWTITERGIDDLDVLMLKR